MSVAVILSGFKRPYSSQQQYDAVVNQTYKPSEIVFWHNDTEKKIEFPPSVTSRCKYIRSSENYGVWGRFAIALMTKSDYVCIIDDDTIPGLRWLENCMSTIKQHDGVLTTRGVIANPNKIDQYPGPDSYTAFGWCNPNEETTRVDIGCHCWFFDKDILRAFWAEAPKVLPMNYGEDMHLSYAAQKHFNLGTYVPPHPVNDTSLWGSQPDTGKQYGEDAVAISWNNIANKGMNSYWNFILNQGYRTIENE
jgi:hypothetical protein